MQIIISSDACYPNGKCDIKKKYDISYLENHETEGFFDDEHTSFILKKFTLKQNLADIPPEIIKLVQDHKKNLKKDVKHIKTMSLNMLGLCYEFGLGSIKIDLNKSITFFNAVAF